MDHTQHMQVERDGALVKLTVKVPEEAMREAEAQLKEDIRRAVRVPGFRPGKTPVHLALAHYGEDAYKADLKEELVKEWLQRGMEEHDLKPATAPKVEIQSFEPGQTLEFEASFEVFPVMEIPDAPALDLPEMASPEVSEEEVEGVLRDLRRRSAALKPREGPAQKDDVVRISRSGHTWEAEADPEGAMGAQLMGVEAGQQVVLKHDDAEETFTVEGVYEVLLPEPEEVAEQYGKDTWDEFREEVRGELLKQAMAEAEHRQRIGALDALADDLKLEAPPGLVEEVVDEEVQRFGGKQELKDEIRVAVQHRLRRELLSRMICEQKGLLPSAEEVQAEAEGDQDSDAVRARIPAQRAADWVLESQRRDA